MKTNTRNLSSNFFNFRLFLEGLKRLRVIGLATAILALTVSAVIPIVALLESLGHAQVHTNHVETPIVCIPMPFVIILAPFFLFALFSFLQKRKESDFFHAIPYTRTCVYVSFVAAALAFVWAIQITCALTAGILWRMVPGATFALPRFIAYVLVCLLASAMLSGFMMLALTVSGTPGSCMLLFVLFAGFTRVVMAIFLGSLESIDLLPTRDMWENSYFSPFWFLPLNVFNFIVYGDSDNPLLYSLPNILYSVAVTLALYALAGVVYKIRKSEMAGSPAPGRISQTVFRVMFTLIPALLIPLFLISGDDDFSLHFVVLVIVLLVYFLYELVTTKRAINMIKAIPSLAFVAAGCIVFFFAYHCYETVILYQKTEADDIKSVTIEAPGLGYGTYQSYLLYELEISAPSILDTVADQLEYSQDCEKFGDRVDDYWNRTLVTLHLKNGRTLRREIIFSNENNAQIMDLLREVDSVRETLYRLPSIREIQDGEFRMHLLNDEVDYVGLHHFSIADIMTVFREEYESLTQEQKDQVMAPTFREDDWYESKSEMVLHLCGEMNGVHYNSEYVIIPEMPRTRAYVMACWAETAYNTYSCGDSEFGGSSSFLMGELIGKLEDDAFADIHQTVTVDLEMTAVGAGENGRSYSDRSISLKSEDLYKLLHLLKDRDFTSIEDKDLRDPANLVFTEESYVLRLTVEDEEQKYHRLYLDVSGLFELSDEDMEALFDILGIKNPMG